MYAETYEAALTIIHNRPKMHKEGSLKRIKRAVAAFQHPEKKLRVIHVAGTNGKGSVVNDLRCLLEEQGLTVGTFTSPFLMRFNERISLNGQPISDKALLDLVNLVGPKITELDAVDPTNQITEFEFITLLMLVYFAEKQPDVAIIEVGIGGLTDATNVVTPIVSVITTIGYDHMALLGDTLPKIAKHKAGIIKERRPVVVGDIAAEPLAVIKQKAASLASPISCLGGDFKAINRNTLPTWAESFDFISDQQVIKNLVLPMLGDYQIDNAAVAIAAFLIFAKETSLKVTERSVRHGLAKSIWAGRLEKINDEPLIILDGAHNEPAVRALAATLRQDFTQQEIYLIFAALKDKDTVTMLKLLEGLPNVHLVLTQFQGARVESVAELAADSAKKIPIFEHWQEAFQAVVQQSSTEDVILLTGSLYFVSEVRQYFKA
ncbi:bifunctional folylpolyglutamate synthase/dihydrofolate synthase [Loigolactobacillus backii]|uniref:tetrahydrofolate synthase n=1 Tax=Loigolactobacillus backii TaxID=375175 RepID=A0A192H466_9LACO|nr:folylpolyglutamate synthase/dihydrofolate synthase family protein [Loigolactobacillus backii]ANK59764.1 bifunctional folylpolyglutamate synthase/dihydrofolate synthase [Loigolactobacillus backii]ANK63165.1 bifunctional folylpolyglutamate synthase/dihydrofolate synthase [Loigolactobacillus backii]ANK64759.1 bifunctional folylpolyglutamate synthase/dihydrofolate synthase [Loigolactobacillus backii]ANK66792.1 bifunctional folylpolyglutamate synthase/dihydrofolate synthase [Loigolactobacillus ba